MTSSAPVCKFMSCRFSCSARDLVYHQYGICRMYSEENPQDFRLPVPCLYSGERVMLLLSAEASFKPGGPFFGEFTSEHLPQGLILCLPSLAYEGSGYPIFRAELSVGIIGKICCLCRNCAIRKIIGENGQGSTYIQDWYVSCRIATI